MGKAKDTCLNYLVPQPDLETANRTQLLHKKRDPRPDQAYQTVTLSLLSAPVTALGIWSSGGKGCEAVMKPKEGFELWGGCGPGDHTSPNARGRVWTNLLYVEVALGLLPLQKATENRETE